MIYRDLKETEKSNPVHISLRKYFDNIIRDRFGPEISTDEIPDITLKDTLMYDMSEDDNTDA